jgi:hypothetical protein
MGTWVSIGFFVISKKQLFQNLPSQFSKFAKSIFKNTHQKNFWINNENLTLLTMATQKLIVFLKEKTVR